MSLLPRTSQAQNEEGTPIHKLPVHHGNVEQLRRQCRVIAEGTQGRVEATVTSSEPKPIPALQRSPAKGLVTNVCVSGDADIVHKTRAKLLNETPIALVSSTQCPGPPFLLTKLVEVCKCRY